jgi:hypothetical protein
MRTAIEMAETISHGWWLDDEKLKAFEDLVRADEREACAKVADRYVMCDPIAKAIRARGNT